MALMPCAQAINCSGKYVVRNLLYNPSTVQPSKRYLFFSQIIFFNPNPNPNPNPNLTLNPNPNLTVKNRSLAIIA